jgi:glycolate oxidase
VGTAKQKYLEMELSPAAIEAMKRIKASFDPKGILNPGKIFPEAGAKAAAAGIKAPL